MDMHQLPPRAQRAGRRCGYLLVGRVDDSDVCGLESEAEKRLA